MFEGVFKNFNDNNKEHWGLSIICPFKNICLENILILLMWLLMILQCWKEVKG